MATITAKDIVDTIIAGDGHYEDDPRVVKIVKYNNAFNGGECWGLIYADEDPDRYAESPFIRNPETVWEADGPSSREASWH